MKIGNSLLYGLPYLLLDKLQRAHNAAARVMVKVSRYNHVTQILESLHWLPVRYRIQYKIIIDHFKLQLCQIGHFGTGCHHITNVSNALYRDIIFFSYRSILAVILGESEPP